MRLLGASGRPRTAALGQPSSAMRATGARQARRYIKQAFQCIESLPHCADPRRTQLLEDALAALASASWWLEDWEEGLADALSCVSGASTVVGGPGARRAGTGVGAEVTR